MVSTQHTQSLSEFRKNAAETINRLNKTGEAEILTVNGEARAVLVSPAVYDQLANEAQIVQDVEVMQRSIRDLKEGKGRKATEFFDELHAELLAMKSQKSKRRKR